MIRLLVPRTLIGLATLWFGSAAVAETPIEIGLDFSPGQVFVQAIEIEWAADRPTGGNRYRMGATLRTEVLERAAEPGGVWTAVTYERLWFERVSGRVSWPDYDSDQTTAKPPAHLPYEGTGLSAVLGQRLQVAYDADGQVARVDDWEPAFQSMIDSFRTIEEVSETEEARKRASFTDGVLEGSVSTRRRAPWRFLERVATRRDRNGGDYLHAHRA